MALIRAATIIPFTSGVPHVGLSFAYDPALVAQLKALGRQLRPATAPDSAVGWLADQRCWFVHPAVWPRVADALGALGHTVVGDIGDAFEPLPPPQSRDAFLGSSVRERMAAGLRQRDAEDARFLAALRRPVPCIHCGQPTPDARYDHCGRCLGVEHIERLVYEADLSGGGA